MGIVYLAHDEQSDGAVAVKMIRPEIADSVNVERFMREARVTAAWEHPHILRVLEVGEADGRPYFVAPWVEGESLAQRLARERQLPLDDAIRITGQVAEALRTRTRAACCTGTSSPATSSSAGSMRTSPTSGSHAPSLRPTTIG